MRNRKRTGWRRVINGLNISAFVVVVSICQSRNIPMLSTTGPRTAFQR